MTKKIEEVVIYKVGNRTFYDKEEAENFNACQEQIANAIRHCSWNLPKKSFYQTERDWLRNNAEEIASKIIRWEEGW